MEDYGDIITRAAGGIATCRSSYASLTFLLWDIIISMDDEVEYIWSRRWSWSKALFIIIRYVPLAFQISSLFVQSGIEYSASACKAWYLYQAIVLQFIAGLVEVILLLRVRVLYAHNPSISWTILVLFVLELVAMSLGTVFTVPRLKFDSTCNIVHSPPELLLYCGSALIFESILFVLTLLKFIEAFRAGWGNTPIIQLLVRDGTWAFALILGIIIINAICYSIVNGPFSGVAFSWIFSILPFAACHLLLNMQRLTTPEVFPSVLTVDAFLDTCIDMDEVGTDHTPSGMITSHFDFHEKRSSDGPISSQLKSNRTEDVTSLPDDTVDEQSREIV